MFYLKSNDGTKIAVYDPNPTGDKTIVFLHGWPLSHKIFEYQEELLLDLNFRVITLDLRGFGDSDAPIGSYCYDQMAHDTYQVVKQLGLRHFILGGFSMGGAIALRYMRNYRGYEVAKLLLLAAAAPIYTMHPGYPYGVTRQSVNELIKQASTDRPQLCEDFSHKKLFYKPHSEALLDWFQDICLEANGYATIQTAISLRDENGMDDLDYVSVPTAVFQGEKDGIVPNDLTLLQHKSIRGSKLYTLEQSGHGMMYDEPEQFNRYLLEFIKD